MCFQKRAGASRTAGGGVRVNDPDPPLTRWSQAKPRAGRRDKPVIEPTPNSGCDQVDRTAECIQPSAGHGNAQQTQRARCDSPRMIRFSGEAYTRLCENSTLLETLRTAFLTWREPSYRLSADDLGVPACEHHFRDASVDEWYRCIRAAQPGESSRAIGPCRHRRHRDRGPFLNTGLRRIEERLLFWHYRTRIAQE
jgi:hypothetical protein